MSRTPAQQQAITLAKEALRRRESLEGAGSAIVAAYGLDPKTARLLQLEEVQRRKKHD